MTSQFYITKTIAIMDASTKEEAWERFKKGEYEEVNFDGRLNDVEKL